MNEFLATGERAQRDEDELDRYAEGLPMEADETSSFDSWCKDAFASRMFDDNRTMRRLQALTLRRMVLLVPHVQKGHVPVVLPFAYDPSVRILILQRYGSGTLILNELPGRTWPGPGRQAAAGLDRGGEVVLGTAQDATSRSPSAGGPAQRATPLVGRDVRLPGWDVSYP